MGLAGLFLAVPAGAGGWTQAPGAAYLRLEGAYRSVDRMFDARGRRTPLSVGGGAADYRILETRGYLEYGAAPGWTIIAAGSWKSATIEEPAAVFRTRGFGDLRLGVRRGLIQGGSWPVALEGDITFPTGYDRQEVPALGSGRMEAMAALQIGHGFRGGYLTAEAGYRVREQGLSDQIPASAELGLNGPGSLSLRVGARGRMALESSGGAADPTVSERSIWSVSGALAWALSERADLEAGISDTVAGRNTLPGVEIFLALAVRR